MLLHRSTSGYSEYDFDRLSRTARDVRADACADPGADAGADAGADSGTNACSAWLLQVQRICYRHMHVGSCSESVQPSYMQQAGHVCYLDRWKLLRRSAMPAISDLSNAGSDAGMYRLHARTESGSQLRDENPDTAPGGLPRRPERVAMHGLRVDIYERRCRWLRSV